jgi:hypothetical protein
MRSRHSMGKLSSGCVGDGPVRRERNLAYSPNAAQARLVLSEWQGCLLLAPPIASMQSMAAFWGTPAKNCSLRAILSLTLTGHSEAFPAN